MAFSNAPLQSYIVDPNSSNTSGPPFIFNKFLKWYEDRQNPDYTASVAHKDTSFTGLTDSNSLGVLNSGVTDHITGNKYFLSCMSTSGYLTTITMANSFRVLSRCISIIHLLPSLSIDMFFMSLGLPLTYCLLVVSLILLIVLFLLPKIWFVYRTRVRDG